MPAPDRRHFLSWERPWLGQAVAWLVRDWPGRGPIDLSGVLALVPTRQSGRRLREALAEFAAARGTAVFAPRVNTPDTLLATGAAAGDVATRLEGLLAWVDVLRAVDLAEVPEVFPVAPPRRDFAWAWRMAESFVALQTQLGESGLGFADVAPRAGAEFPEAERWRQLAALEAGQQARLAALGRRESHAARRAYAAAPRLPDGVREVVLLGSPDPLPLALDVLEIWAQRLPVQVLVFAPESEAAAFDAWGRPVSDAWATRILELPGMAERVHVCADPAEEAVLVSEAIARYAPQPAGQVAAGLADPEVLPLLENALSRAGIASYNPEGRLRKGGRWHGLLVALAEFHRNASFEAVAALARCLDFLAGLAERTGEGFSAARFLRQLDDARAETLAPDFAALERVVARQTEDGDLRAGLVFLGELRRALRTGDFPENVLGALGRIFHGRQFDLADLAEAREAEAAGEWRDLLAECARARAGFPQLEPDAWWEAALRLFAGTRETEEKMAGALDLQGWLELLWEDAPHLIVAGLNDGLVPDAIVGDAFLPEGLRERLGLKTNGARFARDAYILQAIAAARARGGRLDLALARHATIGDPLRPSRLLLRCADAELPERIAFLFRTPESARRNLPWTRAWRLDPRRAPVPSRVPVTGLRAWLGCPFRFYLQHVLRMEAVDPAKSELDARDFGTLCHAALEAMARERALRDCTDEARLREFLLARFDAAARARLGEELTLPLVVQLESARQRLARAAAVQARDRSEGWIIERAEWAFELDFDGLTVRGKIDRCDRHEGTGAWRVLDYKTTDAGPTPHKAHLRPFRAGDEARPEWMRVEVDGRECVWSDLQLPLYLRALGREAVGGHAVSCGYFKLPKAVGETAIATWSELTPELLASADACAAGVTAAIRAGEFWPPVEIASERDPFAPLFHHGAEESVAWRASP